MKHTYNFIYTLLLALMTVAFSACSQDADINGGAKADQKVSVRLNIGTAAGGGSRAVATPTWVDGSADENMFSWVVVITNNSDQIVNVLEKTLEKGVTKDALESFKIDAGTYNFYSFANIEKNEVAKLAGFSDGNFPTEFTSNNTANFDCDYAIAGNKWDIANHIPMSNKQTITITDATTSIDLWVVRMLAKVTVKFRNTSTSNIKVTALGLNSITDNPAEGSVNIKLLPNKVDGADKVACEPNLAENATASDFTYTIANEGLTVNGSTNEYTDENSVTFYVNESKTAGSDVFELSLDTDKGLRRYALIADWNTIARNDWHVLKVNLDDYKLELGVESFTQIGVEPSVTVAGDKVLTYTSYLPEEEFHIIPTLTKLANPEENVAIGSATLECLSGTPADVFYKTSETEVPGSPAWVKASARIEGKYGILGDSSKAVTYRLTVNPADDTAKNLCYKLVFKHDLSWINSSRAATTTYKWSTADRRWMKIVPVVVE